MPTVVISSPSDRASSHYQEEFDFDDEGNYSDGETSPVAPIPSTPPLQIAAGRAPSAAQGPRNFSLPNRPNVPGNDDAKHRVLERNSHSHRGVKASDDATSPTSTSSSASSAFHTAEDHFTAPSQLDRPKYQFARGDVAGRPSSPASLSSSSLASSSYHQGYSRGSPSPSPSQSQLSSKMSNGALQQQTYSPVSPMSSPSIQIPNTPQAVRMSSHTSVYSDYSYYHYPDTPTADNFLSSSPSGAGLGSLISPSSSTTSVNTPESSRSGRRTSPARAKPAQSPSGQKSAEAYLSLGIEHHEAGRLQESAFCFEKSATIDGGCAVGMLMWGLSLRHSWGCEKDEAKAFKWLKRAAEHSVEDLQAAKEGREALKVGNIYLISAFSR